MPGIVSVRTLATGVRSLKKQSFRHRYHRLVAALTCRSAKARERIDIADGKGVLSDRDLAVLTDRSEEAFERAEKGEDAVGAAFKAVETRRDGEGLLESLQK